jgi:hypothetical protein
MLAIAPGFVMRRMRAYPASFVPRIRVRGEPNVGQVMRLTSDALVLRPEELATRRLRIALLSAIALSFAGQLAIVYEFVNQWPSLHGPAKWIFAPLMAGNLVYALWLAREMLRRSAFGPFNRRALVHTTLLAAGALPVLDGLPEHRYYLSFACAAVLFIVAAFIEKPK